MRTLALVVVIAVPAFAQTVYSWEDADGVHYTDDLAQVPKSKKVEEQVLEGRPLSKGLSGPKPAPVPPEVTANEAQATANEYEWRDRFIAAHRRIDSLARSISALQSSLPPRIQCVPQPVRLVGGVQRVGQPTSRCQINPFHDQLQAQIAQQSVELRDAQLDLEQLDRRASLEAVPREWRRGW